MLLRTLRGVLRTPSRAISGLRTIRTRSPALINATDRVSLNALSALGDSERSSARRPPLTRTARCPRRPCITYRITSVCVAHAC